jgi:mannose-6-phosphate isomerase-like protein (cupin superfamily)
LNICYSLLVVKELVTAVKKSASTGAQEDAMRKIGLALLGLFTPALIAAAPAAHHATSDALTYRHPMDAPFKAIPNAATCNTMAPLRGDMSKGPATFTSRMTPGCVAPWHWHSPTEEIVILQGTARMQMDDDSTTAITLPVGAYSQLPRNHLHRFRCLQGADCVILVIADAAFDIHWVDKNRKEISFEEALKREAASGGSDW